MSQIRETSLLAQEGEANHTGRAVALFGEDELRRARIRAVRIPVVGIVPVDEHDDVGVLEMRAKARRLQAEHGLSLLIVDYLQLMSARGRYENRTLELASISRSLKGLAKELNVPVVALSSM